MAFYVLGLDRDRGEHPLGGARVMLMTSRPFPTYPQAASHAAGCAEFYRAFVVGPESYICRQCGQRIDDGRACGCGARP